MKFNAWAAAHKPVVFAGSAAAVAGAAYVLKHRSSSSSGAAAPLGSSSVYPGDAGAAVYSQIQPEISQLVDQQNALSQAIDALSSSQVGSSGAESQLPGALPPAQSAGPVWGTDVAGVYPGETGGNVERGFAFLPGSSTQGYTVDAWGNVHPFATGGAAQPPDVAQNTGVQPGQDVARGIQLTSSSGGYWLDETGQLHPFSLNTPAPASTQA